MCDQANMAEMKRRCECIKEILSKGSITCGELKKQLREKGFEDRKCDMGKADGDMITLEEFEKCMEQKKAELMGKMDQKGMAQCRRACDN